LTKTPKATFAWLLLTLLLLASGSDLIQLSKACDEEHPANASNLYSTEWQVGEPDSSNVTFAFSEIYNIFDQQRYYVWVELWPYTPIFDEPVYEHLNNFEALTTKSLVTDEIYDCEHSYPFVTVFYYGHMDMVDDTGLNYPWWNYGFREQAELDDPLPDTIWDTVIYYAPTDGDHHFAFLWVCNNGNIGGCEESAVWDAVLLDSR
jgi:hypothetical protein